MAIDWDSLVLAPVMGVFGGEAGDWVLTPAAGGDAVTVTDGVFDEAYTAVFETPEGPTSTVMPVLGVRAALFETRPRKGDLVESESAGRFRIREVRPDGHGHLLLLLNEAAP